MIVDDVAPAGFVAAPGSTLSVVAGGSIGRRVTAIDANVNILGGSVGLGMQLLGTSNATISGGHYSAHDSERGFSLGLRAKDNSSLTISGGIVESLIVEDQSDVTISGGLVFEIRNRGGAVTFVGDFLVDGEPIPGLAEIGDRVTVDLRAGSVISGSLADGTAFFRTGGDLTVVKSVIAPVTGPTNITASTDSVPLRIGDGQTLVVDHGSTVSHSVNVSSGGTIRVDGGSIASKRNVNGRFVRFREVNAIGGKVVVSAGNIGDIKSVAGGKITITGGSAADISTYHGGHAEISGGSVENLSAREGSTIDIRGGSFGFLNAEDGSVVTFSGGIEDKQHFRAWAGSEIHILGQAFSLNGQPIEGLANVGDSVILDVERQDQALEGTLLDGNPFRINLISFPHDGCYSFGCNDYIDANATLRLTLSVPEPSGIIIGSIGLLLLSRLRRLQCVRVMAQSKSPSCLGASST